MRGVFSRKQKMVQGELQFHLDRFKATGAELIKGEARFVAPKTVEVNLADEGKRMITGDRVFLDLGARSTIPDIPGLAAAKPMSHVEALDLQRLPEHVIVLGGGYVGLELAQALRRFGAAVTLIERSRQPTWASLFCCAAMALVLPGMIAVNASVGTCGISLSSWIAVEVEGGEDEPLDEVYFIAEILVACL